MQNQTFKKSLPFQITENGNLWNTRYVGSLFLSQKHLANTERIIQTNLENGIKTLDLNLKNEKDFNTDNWCKLELENIYDEKAEGAKIHMKCEWYQPGEKPTKFILNLEKQKGINTTVRLLMTPKILFIIKRSMLAYVSFTKTFSKRMSLNQIQKRNRF